MKLRVNYATRLRQAREDRLLTQDEAAEQLGVARRTYQHWEAGTVEPRARHLRRISEWLAV